MTSVINLARSAQNAVRFKTNKAQLSDVSCALSALQIAFQFEYVFQKYTIIRDDYFADPNNLHKLNPIMNIVRHLHRKFKCKTTTFQYTEAEKNTVKSSEL